MATAEHSSSQLTLRVLGDFSLERNGQPRKISYEKGRALLAYLAIEPNRAHPRTALAGMLWPDLEREAALANLRLVLHNLRQTLNANFPDTPPLLIDREFIRLDHKAGISIDVIEFSGPLPGCPSDNLPSRCTHCISQMDELVAHYRGSFMAGFSLPECVEFEEWLDVQREALHLRALTLLSRLSDCQEQMGQREKALNTAQRFLALEPWNENGLQRTMRLLALDGQGAAALSAFETCAIALKRELGILPSSDSIALAASIRNGELSSARNRDIQAVQFSSITPPPEEQRQLTVLSCGFRTSEEHEIDESRHLLLKPQQQFKDIISRHSGYFVPTHGCSFLAYFGYPNARENATRLAAHAALSIARTTAPGIVWQIGIHTGLAISNPQTPDITGITSEHAILLHHQADAQEIIISETTQRLIAPHFECFDLGIQLSADRNRSLNRWRVIQEKESTEAIDREKTSSPLIGRKNEARTLLTRWKEACQGTRHIIQLRGEAGIGKTRLIEHLKYTLTDQDFALRELQCSAENSLTPFHPLSRLLESWLEMSSSDAKETKLNSLREYIGTHINNPDDESLALLARLLSIPEEGSPHELKSSAQQQREKTMSILLERLQTLSEQQPLLMIVEDIHWADPSTLEFLHRCVLQKRIASFLLILSFRPEFSPPWHRNSVKTINLKPLSQTETSCLVSTLSPQAPPATVLQIVERADGIPLFAEQLSRELNLRHQPAIPVSLHDLLATRLDGLGEAKTTAQLAATIGREFRYELLRRISAIDETTLTRQIKLLLERMILSILPGGLFQFKHALIRDAAYLSQSREERASTHRRIFGELIRSYPETRPELLAHHATAGEQNAEAIANWLKSGQLAIQHSASHEAISYFNKGLALLGKLAEDTNRASLELQLQIGLGIAACAVQGYGSKESAQAFERAMSLYRVHENDPAMFPSIWGLWASTSSHSDHDNAHRLAQQLMRMGQQSNNPVYDQQGHFALADTLYWQGDFIKSREHLEYIKVIYSSTDHAKHISEFGEDAGVTSGAYLSWSLWFLGFSDQAMQVSLQTVALAHRLGHPFSQAYALSFAAILRCRMRLPDEALLLAEETLALATKHGFGLWQIGAELARSWALSQQQKAEGIDILQSCAAAVQSAMGGVTLVVLAPLIEANISLRRFDAALTVLDEAFTLSQSLGDHHIEAELYRFMGEALLGQSESNADEAEACFKMALTISRQQQSRTLELRAATSLAVLWKAQDKRDAARTLLEDVFEWFSEGHGTSDLKDARGLLDTLAAH